MGPVCGLMIDDFVVLDRVPRSLTLEDRFDSPGACIVNEVRRAYESVSLPRHPGKAVESETCAEFWGGVCDGLAGVMRPAYKRAVPLAHLVLSCCVELKLCTPELLETLAGGLVSCLHFRRRCLSVLDYVYSGKPSGDRNLPFDLSPELRDELLLSVALLPQADMDFRAEAAPLVIASDASSSAEAAAFCHMPQPASQELFRHTLAKGLWNKLLAPYPSLLREKGLLDCEEELPGDEPGYVSHPLWEEIALSSKFENFGRIVHVRTKRHINLGEIRAAVAAEERLSRDYQDVRYVHLQGSQVSIAALTKGRSSSRAINRELQRSLPCYLGSGLRPGYGFLRSKLNPSDDRTRGVPLRCPARKPAAWMTRFLEGDLDALDSALKDFGLSIEDLRGLPDPGEITQSREFLGLPPLPQHLPFMPEPGKVHQSAGRREPSPPRPDVLTHAPPVCAGPSRLRRSKQPLLSAQLSRQARRLLKRIPESQFVLHGSFTSLQSALAWGRGWLDLFSGSRGLAKALVAVGAAPWALCWDIRHGQAENLLDPEVRIQIEELLATLAFLGLSGGPVCASFSTAICPPWRTKEYPEGVPWATDSQKEKMKMGNSFCNWTSSLFRKARALDILALIENPQNSHFWRQACWDEQQPATGWNDFLVDYCVFGTPWKKATRFRVSGVLEGERQRCRCGPCFQHQVLRGWNKELGQNWTRVAEPYPRRLCNFVARQVLKSLEQRYKADRLDVAACAQTGQLRVGEAANPGPRRRRERPPVVLAGVALVEPATEALQLRFWRAFEGWVCAAAGEDAVVQASKVPQLLVELLTGFAQELYDAGTPLHYYRQLVAYVQRRFSGVRPFIRRAWDMISKWELLEPIQHRPPLPEPLLQAMCALAISWGWRRWAAVTTLAFYSLCRPGEPLRAVRSDLLTSSDLLEDGFEVYLRVGLPKTRRRGATMQHVRLQGPTFVHVFVSEVLQGLDPFASLFGGSPSAYRRRWDSLLRSLLVGPEHRLTPGPLRGGGAVSAHRRGESVSEVQWRLRLKHQGTLVHYLQEVVALSVLPSLSARSRELVKAAAALLPFLAQSVRPRGAQVP